MLKMLSINIYHGNKSPEFSSTTAGFATINEAEIPETYGLALLLRVLFGPWPTEV